MNRTLFHRAALASAAALGLALPLAHALTPAAATAAPGSAGANADAAVNKALASLAPGLKVDKIEAAPLPGYRQVIAGGHVIYVSDDGKYLLQGALFDTQTKRDLSAARLAVENKAKIDAVPQDERIVFAPADKPKYTITVFTDLDCGYCRKMHSQIAEYNKRGIEVDYLFYPRSGIPSPSYDKAVSVWCAKDRKATFTAAKAGINPPPLKCDNPVAEEYKLGTLVGVDGTPTVLAPDGSKIGGYLAPDEMLSVLQRKALTLAGN